jgi:multidrug efflux system membrane fusion protein
MLKPLASLFGALIAASLLAAPAGAQTGAAPAGAEAEAAPAGAEAEAAPAGAGQEPVHVVALRSEARDFSERLTLRGRTEADRRVDARAEVSGRVASRPIRKGAMVEAGDVLCQLDPGERPAAVAEAEAELRQAEVQFDAARRLNERGFTAETEALTREAQLEAARARLMRAQLDMDRLEIRAPFDGVLESDTAELGEYLQPGSLCATLIALDPITLVGFSPEAEVDRIKVGQGARARLVTGREIEGEVRFVSRAADESTRTYRIEIEAPNPELVIRDGMTAEIGLELGARPAHFLPQSALTLGDDGRLGVRLVEDGRAAFAPVRRLADEAGGVWVEGLPETAEVIVVGQEFAGEGQAVAPTYRSAEAL